MNDLSDKIAQDSVLPFPTVGASVDTSTPRPSSPFGFMPVAPSPVVPGSIYPFVTSDFSHVSMRGFLYVGIDPGLLGAYAAIDGNGTIVSYLKTPRDGKSGTVDFAGVWGWFKSLSLPRFTSATVVLEDVHPLPGVSARSTWTFSENKGMNLMLAWFLCYEFYSNVRFRLITPKHWQKATWDLGDRVEKDGKCDTKATSLNAARRIWPGESFLASEKSKKPDDGIVDALLIAEAARRLGF